MQLAAFSVAGLRVVSERVPKMVMQPRTATPYSGVTPFQPLSELWNAGSQWLNYRLPRTRVFLYGRTYHTDIYRPAAAQRNVGAGHSATRLTRPRAGRIYPIWAIEFSAKLVNGRSEFFSAGL